MLKVAPRRFNSFEVRLILVGIMCLCYDITSFNSFEVRLILYIILTRSKDARRFQFL